MLVALVLVAMLAVSPTCRPVGGAEALWAAPQVRYVIIGETHGTAQAPALFADLVCLAAASGRDVAVAVEQPESAQNAIDAFLQSDGGTGARTRFLASPIWHDAFTSGLSSGAYFTLFERLRGLKAAGLISRVTAIKPGDHGERTASETGYNAVMAQLIEAAAPRLPGSLLLVLVGNVHAAKNALGAGEARLVPAAANLPAKQTLSLYVRTSGEAWNCMRDGCGVHAVAEGEPVARKVTLSRAIVRGYDGVIDLGVRSTASAPAERK